MSEENNNEVWDEHRWEEEMERMEKKSEEYRKFLEEEMEKGDFLSDEDIEDNPDEERTEEEEDFYPDELEEEDWDDLDFISDLDEGEEWKDLSDEFPFYEHGSVKNFELYNRGYELGLSAARWAENIDEKYQNEGLKEFVSNTLIISAKLAGGYSFGFEREFIGGNIANTKKAINAANKALAALEDSLKGQSFISKKKYTYFHTNLFEIRNDIGIYIQKCVNILTWGWTKKKRQ